MNTKKDIVFDRGKIFIMKFFNFLNSKKKKKKSRKSKKMILSIRSRASFSVPTVNKAINFISNPYKIRK